MGTEAETMETKGNYVGIPTIRNGIVMEFERNCDGNIMGMESRSAVDQPYFCSGTLFHRQVRGGWHVAIMAEEL